MPTTNHTTRAVKTGYPARDSLAHDARAFPGRAKRARKIDGLTNICPNLAFVDYGLLGQPDYIKLLI